MDQSDNRRGQERESSASSPGTKAKPGRRRQFLAQGSILALAGILVRVIGLAGRIPIVNIIGEQGSGYYSVAYEVYNVALILSSYSLPLAISKLMAAREVKQQYRESYRVFQCAMVFALCSGLFMALILFFGADFIAEHLFHMPGIVLPLRVLAPTVLVCAILGVMRGLYQGKGTMIPTALSQILEQIVNVVVSVLAASLLMRAFATDPMVYSYGAMGSTLGTFSGAAFGLLFLVIVFLMYRPTLRRQFAREERQKQAARRQRLAREHRAQYAEKEQSQYEKKESQGFSNPQQSQALESESTATVFHLLLFTIVPVILSQTIYQISGLLDDSLFNNIMASKGMAEVTRSSLIGIYGSKYRTLINVPIAISQAIVSSMVPSIVACIVSGHQGEARYQVRSSIKFNMLIAIPAAMGLGVLAKPILQLLFAGTQEPAFQILRYGAPAVVFYALSTVTNGVLQGVNRMRLPVIHSAISLAIHLALCFLLLRFTNLGIFVLVIGNVTFPLVVALLNWRSIRLELGYRQEIKTTFLLPLVASVIMGAAALLIYQGCFLLLHSNLIACLAAIAAAVVVYLVAILLLKVLTREEWLDFPMGGRLVRLFERFGLLR